MNIQQAIAKAENIFASDNELFFHPVGYWSRFQILAARCHWCIDGVLKTQAYIHFDGCTKMKVDWSVTTGPMNILITATSNQLEFSDQQHDFQVVCEAVYEVEKAEHQLYLQNA